jgi:hypothetical protein
MIKAVVGSFKSRLSPDVFNLVQNDVEKWANQMLTKFPEGKPQ